VSFFNPERIKATSVFAARREQERSGTGRKNRGTERRFKTKCEGRDKRK
jgi:hypothetical protein